MEKDIIATATTYHMQYGHAEGEVIDWKILSNDENLDWAMPNIPNNVEFQQDIELDDDNGLCDIFFEEVFPCIKGHGKLMDEFHSNTKSPYFLAVFNDGISFTTPTPGILIGKSNIAIY
jgi:hypothetical protein